MQRLLASSGDTDATASSKKMASKMKEPAVSVIMPCFNSEDTVIEAMRSVLRQRANDWELLVIDDGSSDATTEQVNSLSDQRIRLIELGANRGVAYARNIGISEARGSWIQFLDADDVIAADKLDSQLSVAENVEIVLSDCEHVYPDGKRKVFGGLNKSGRLCIEDLIDRNPILIHAPIVKRNLLDSTSLFDGSYEHEDWAFWLNLATRKPRLRYLDGVRCTYNRRSGSRSFDLIQNLQSQIACLLKFRKKLSRRDNVLNEKFDNSIFQIRKRLLKLLIDAHRLREAQDVLHKLTAG